MMVGCFIGRRYQWLLLLHPYHKPPPTATTKRVHRIRAIQMTRTLFFVDAGGFIIAESILARTQAPQWTH
jgi:hypothetical protein